MEKNNILLPTYPKLKSKRLIDDSDNKMAEIDKAIGITKAKENDIKKRSVDEKKTVHLLISRPLLLTKHLRPN